MAKTSKPSLAETHPELAAQAVGWDPTMATHGSNLKVQWVCNLRHVWEARIVSRTGLNQGCPYCSGARAWPGFNDLASVRPEIASRAFQWDPQTLTSGSNKVVEWLCDKGHVWKASVKSLVHGQGCAVCAGQQVQEGVNDLRTLFPDLANELVNLSDYLVTQSSGKSLLWKCFLGHEWLAKVSRRTQGDGCPYCSGHRLLVGFNDVATKNPEIAAEADGWDPSQVYFATDKNLNWKCFLGHEWVASAESRAKLGSKCPICNNRKIEIGFNDLATTHPELALQAFGWDPRTEGAGSSHNPKLWRCVLGHEWKAVINSRAVRGGGCPYCSFKTVLSGFKDLATTHPNLIEEADGWDPTTVIAGTNKVLTWKCKLGHQWKSKGTNRTTAGAGCPICSGNVVLKGFNDLATTHPELAKAAVDWDPTQISKGHQKKLKWVCEKGHLWSSAVNQLTRGGWCPICAGKQVLKDYNDLATTDPGIAAEAVGWDPSTVMRGHAKKKLWRCSKGHQWSATPGSRSSGKTGCQSCSISGYDPNKDGYLYFIDHDLLGMYQIGITNSPTARLADHQRRKWEVIELRGPSDGHLTQKLETNCLHALEKRGAILGHKAGIDKFDGYTEAWTKASLNVTSIKQILDWVYEDETK